MGDSKRRMINNISVVIVFLNLALVVLKLVKEATKD